MIVNNASGSIKTLITILQKLDARFSQKLEFFKNTWPCQSLLSSHTFRKIPNAFSFFRFSTLHPGDLIIAKSKT